MNPLRNVFKMSNGLGAGFASLTILVALTGLACLGILATITRFAFYRRTGRLPASFRYLHGAILAVVLAVAGFGVLALYDEAPAAAGVFALTVLFPILVGGFYFDRTTERSRFDVAITTFMTWGPSFLVGVVFVFGTMVGVSSIFDLAPAETRQMGIAWLASTVGGVVVVLGMIFVGTRLRGLIGSGMRTGDWF